MKQLTVRILVAGLPVVGVAGGNDFEGPSPAISKLFRPASCQDLPGYGVIL